MKRPAVDDASVKGGEELRSTEVLEAAALPGLVDEWEELALRTAAPPFSLPGWVEPWWQAFGAGELLLVTARRDGALTGVLPLGRRRGRLRACANVHSGLFDLVAAGDADADALLRAALGLGRSLVCPRVATDGRLAGAARRIAAGGGCQVVVLGTARSSRIEAPSWDDYEAGLKSKRRSDNRRVAKRLGKLGELGFRRATDLEAMAADMAEFLLLEATSWKLDQGTAISQSPSERAFYEQVVRRGLETGPARLTFVTLDGRPVAAQISLDGGGVRYGLKTGFQEELSRYSPGLFLQISEVRRALEAGLAFELGTGDEPLKRDLRTAAWEMETLGLFPTSPLGRLGGLEERVRAALRGRASESRLVRRGRDAIRSRRAQSRR